MREGRNHKTEYEKKVDAYINDASDIVGEDELRAEEWSQIQGLLLDDYWCFNRAHHFLCTIRDTSRFHKFLRELLEPHSLLDSLVPEITSGQIFASGQRLPVATLNMGFTRAGLLSMLKPCGAECPKECDNECKRHELNAFFDRRFPGYRANLRNVAAERLGDNPGMDWLLSRSDGEAVHVIVTIYYKVSYDRGWLPLS